MTKLQRLQANVGWVVHRLRILESQMREAYPNDKFLNGSLTVFRHALQDSPKVLGCNGELAEAHARIDDLTDKLEDACSDRDYAERENKLLRHLLKSGGRLDKEGPMSVYMDGTTGHTTWRFRGAGLATRSHTDPDQAIDNALLTLQRT